MKRIGWLVMALLLVCGGCAQSGKGPQDASTAYRLQNLEAGFTKFQDQAQKAEAERRARDADIDNKLRDIASRLGVSQTGQPQAGASASAKASTAVLAKSSGRKGAAESQRHPVVAGQIIPLAQVYSSPQAGSAAPAIPVMSGAPVAPGQAQPSNLAPPAPSSAAAPQQTAPVAAGQDKPASPVPAAPNQSQSAPAAGGQMQPLNPASSAIPALRPPVVTLPPVTVAQPAAMAPGAPRQPMPVSAPAKRGRGTQESPAPQPLAPAIAPAAAAPAVAATPAAGAASRITGEEGQAYVDAMRAVTANKNEEGRRKLNDFMAKYPGSVKAPEAQFWIGESYMNEKGYNQAILAFKDVTTRFPKDPKAAESLFRAADAYEKLGDKNNAVFHLKILVEEHPASEWASKAKQKLKQLGQ